MSNAASPTQVVTPTDLAEIGRTMATLNDWRAIMLVSLVMIALLLSSLILIIVWDRVAQARMLKALDKVSDALWALRLALAQRGVTTFADQERAQSDHERANKDHRRAADREEADSGPQ